MVSFLETLNELFFLLLSLPDPMSTSSKQTFLAALSNDSLSQLHTAILPVKSGRDNYPGKDTELRVEIGIIRP